jgi:putative transposase
MIEGAIDELTALVGTSAACAAVGRTRQTHYRWHRQESTDS